MSLVHPVGFFDPPSRPNGGTVYVDPARSGNPYARITEEAAQPIATVDLPDFEEES